MRKILGLDLGTTSIGWAFVNEAENDNEKSSIVKLGVRVIPISTDEENDFLKGKAISINADRTLKRGARRNLDRFQLRRDKLINLLKENNLISDESAFSEEGKNSTYETYKARAKAVRAKVTKEEFAKILLMINKKRGYKSSRKAKNEDEGTAIDGMGIAKMLFEEDLTPGQYVYKTLKEGKKIVPDFYRSDLQNEFNKIWDFQKQFYPEILTDEFKENIKGKGKKATSGSFFHEKKIYTAQNKGKRDAIKLQSYKWRSEAAETQLNIEEVAYVIVEINNNLNSSSSYLGAISDRSKELYFNKQTVGEYLYTQLEKNPHTKLKNQVFYRQDYMDEFDVIWKKQKEYYSELTNELYLEIRNETIFYQRPLKSQKGLLSICEFENWKKDFVDEATGEVKTRIIGHKVIPKSSPLFQEFKIWQIINNIEIKDNLTNKKFKLEQETKELLFNELNIREKLSAKEVLKLVVNNPNDCELKYKEIEGNKTNAELYKIFQQILGFEGKEYNFSKMKAEDINDILNVRLTEIGIDSSLLIFNSEIEGNSYDKQAILQLWHLLYSYEGDNSNTGIEKLLKKLELKFGFKREYAQLIANISLKDDYGSLSSKAIRKILPYLKEGNGFDIACHYAGYNHSHSKTKDELASRELKLALELLPKNSLRNPVVEKILNQLVNVVNAIMLDESLGKPDEIRIELARELKYTSAEREKMTKGINEATLKHEKIRTKLQTDFGIKKVTRNDIIKYKLYEELKNNGYKTLYTNVYVSEEKLFSKDFDIEHIIPQARIFDDSFSNKTLSVRQINIEKGNETAYDYLKNKLNDKEFIQYLERIENLYKNKEISKAKYQKLKMKSSEIQDGFIDRDLRNSQYIAKKAKQMLEEVVRTVNSTTGKITDRLRSDWQIIDVMKELNFPKYEKVGLIETIEGKDGQPEQRIKDWTKRNDHRHHAMDALTVAFTSYSHVQYLNNLNARKNEAHEKYHSVYGIEKKYLHRNKRGKLIFNPPMPLHEFRAEAKKHLESILISFKAKNKVVTRNKNKIKGQKKPRIELTPRGQLHKETIYGKSKKYKTKKEKIGTKFDKAKIELVANSKIRSALLKRLEEFENNPKKAFGGKNSPSKNPIYIDELRTIEIPEKVKLVWLENIYTIRKDINPELKIDKVVDVGIRNILRKRLSEFDNDAKKAFVNLDDEPIWLNKEKGISIKRVTITGVSNARPIHYKRDHKGEFILDKEGKKQAADFVSTGNNHHVAIYKDEKGKLQEEVVSFFEAVELRNHGLPIINKTLNQEKGWEFLFTMKQNEYFVFPSSDFDPNEVDLLDPANASILSPHLYRVQKIATKDYVFRHHLETNVENIKELTNISYKRTGLLGLVGVLKVRINHLGQIVHVGEY